MHVTAPAIFRDECLTRGTGLRLTPFAFPFEQCLEAIIGLRILLLPSFQLLLFFFGLLHFFEELPTRVVMCRSNNSLLSLTPCITTGQYKQYMCSHMGQAKS
jgi:hypothetical protein